MEAESSKDGKRLAPPRPLLFPLAVVASMGTAEESIVSQIMLNTKMGAYKWNPHSKAIQRYCNMYYGLWVFGKVVLY